MSKRITPSLHHLTASLAPLLVCAIAVVAAPQHDTPPGTEKVPPRTFHVKLDHQWPAGHEKHEWYSAIYADKVRAATGRVWKCERGKIYLSLGDLQYAYNARPFLIDPDESTTLTDDSGHRVSTRDYVTIIYCAVCRKIRYVIFLRKDQHHKPKPRPRPRHF